ncbi:hypothetical protein GCM10008090_27820 [Arenicella chitinivorans]|uniref:Uncharacterized protein n=1 Tax=Arenicella chitinivorans TaxID=1329800 RepID=A0A918RXR7_9GAMM|nr:hypothetical protein GCM10008090_27820 [Arenicella chitinivorans]
MKKRALCIKCYEWKSDHMDECESCHYSPVSEIDICKSRILDFPWDFQSPETGELISVGKTFEELESIRDEFSRGIKYEYSDWELQSLSQVLRAYKSTQFGFGEYAFIIGFGIMILVSIWYLFVA